MTTIVFLGPTLPRERARELLVAEYVPPARAGDVLRAAASGASTIVLIDGYYECCPSVWHKEILCALASGIRVIGAASMGALRASELHTFGMEGVGLIFEQFASGALADDDEVAILHGPEDTGYRPLSDAMVNIRTGVERARAAGLITESTARAVVESAKREHFTARSWASLRRREDLGPAEEIDRLATFVSRTRPDQKAEDAELALRIASEPRAHRHVTLPPPETIFLRRLRRSLGL